MRKKRYLIEGERMLLPKGEMAYYSELVDEDVVAASKKKAVKIIEGRTPGWVWYRPPKATEIR